MFRRMFNATRLTGIKSKHPEVVEAIKNRLIFLRERGAPVNLITARALIVASVLHMKLVFGSPVQSGLLPLKAIDQDQDRSV